MSRNVALSAAALFLLVALPAAADNVKVVNKSEWSIYQFFLAPADSEEWGPDHLGDDVIEPGSSTTLQNVPCDVYDVKLVDEEGEECIVAGVEVCSGNHEWVITSGDLALCQGYGD